MLLSSLPVALEVFVLASVQAFHNIPYYYAFDINATYLHHLRRYAC